VTVSLASLALYAERKRQAWSSDPIAEHLFSSPQARDMVRSVCAGLETLLRSGNAAGKTTEGAFLGVCMARGVREVDARTILEARRGVPRETMPLPALPVPNVGIIAVESYKQAQGSTIAAYLNMIGDWPHVAVKGAQGYVTEFRIKPDRSKSDNPDTWSRIYVFPSDGAPPKGIRAHWVHLDEPPSPAMLGELRMRLTAGQPLYRWITMTPIRREDFWIRDDYAEASDWKREIQLSVFDNQALTRADKKALREAAENDPQGLTLARLHGAYVDVGRKNPWIAQQRILAAWLARCRDPIREEQLMMPIEVETDQGLRVEGGFGTVYIWGEPVEGEKYYAIADSALGIDDAEHDPLGLHIVSRGFRGRPGLVARYNGFCGGYALGRGLMAPLAERYNNALCDPDVTGGYGQPVLRGLADYKSDRWPEGYGNINRDRKIDMSGTPYSGRLGFVVTTGAKADLIECIRYALTTGSIDVWSAATVRCLMDAVVDNNGKLVKPKGVHYEDFHCLARAIQLIMDRNQEEKQPQRETEIQAMLRQAGVRQNVFAKAKGNGTPKFNWSRS
jgi:hypothetical protein